jgi:hypothetical protein
MIAPKDTRMDEDSVSSELAGCPFCGAPPIVAGSTIWCANKGCWGPHIEQYENLDDAIAAWNCRSTIGGEPVAEEQLLASACRTLMTKIYNRGHSGLDLDCRLCQAYIAADRLLSFETGAPLSEEVVSWDRRHPAPATGEGVKVKALEWKPLGAARQIFSADTTIGEYTVEYYETPGEGAGWSAVYQDGRELGDYATQLAAEEASQADYEARIRSALVHPSIGDSEAGAESSRIDVGSYNQGTDDAFRVAAKRVEALRASYHIRDRGYEHKVGYNEALTDAANELRALSTQRETAK